MAQLRSIVAMLLLALVFAFSSLTIAAEIDGEEVSQPITDSTDPSIGEIDASLDGAAANEKDDISEEQMEELMKKLNRGGDEDMFGSQGKRYTRDIPAVEEDVPHIQCQTCEELVKHVQSRIEDRKRKIKSKKVAELEILEWLETICDPLTGDGEWISQYDVVEKDDGLVLVNKGQIGHCEEECKTMVVACDNVVKEADSMIAELLYTNKPGAVDKICGAGIKKLKGGCGQPAIPIRADRVVAGDNFKPKSDIDIALAEAGKELRMKQQINPDFLRDEV